MIATLDWFEKHEGDEMVRTSWIVDVGNGDTYRKDWTFPDQMLTDEAVAGDKTTWDEDDIVAVAGPVFGMTCQRKPEADA
jgi:hypothetical protein